MTATYPFRLGYSCITWGPTPDLDEVLGAIAGAGWEGVEFIGVSADWLGTPRRLRGLLDRYGLQPVCLFGSVSLGPDADLVLERQRRTIEYAAELGCAVYCFLGGERVGRRLPSEDEFKRLAEQAERLIDHAAPSGLTVAYHVKIAPHGAAWPEINAHLVAAQPHGVIVPATTPGLPPEVWAHLYQDFAIRAGQIRLTDRPGLGLDFDEDFLKRYQVATIA